MTTALLSLTIPAMAEDSLGLSVSVVPDAREDGLATGNGRLWFAMEPGSSYSRQISLRSSATVDQLVTLEFRDYAYTNGVRSLGSDPSIVNEWLTLNPGTIVVGAGESVEVDLLIDPPSDAPEQAFEGAMVVLASAAQVNDEQGSGEKVRVEVATQIALNIEFWVGVGAAENLYPTFDIRSLEGRIGDDGSKEVRIYFENTGLIPLKLSGSAQFLSPTFDELTFGPYEFRTKDIPTGQIGFVDVEVSQELLEGPWQILVAAQQDGIKQTKLFEQEISFSGASSLAWLVPLVASAAVIFFVGLGIFGLRLLRRNPRSVTPTSKPEPAPQAKTPMPNGEVIVKPSRDKFAKKSRYSEGSESRDGSRVATTVARRKSEPVKTEFDLELDSWAESLRSSIREVRSDSTDLVEKYKDVPTRKPRKTRPKD